MNFYAADFVDTARPPTAYSRTDLLHGKDALSPLSLTAQRRASAQRCSSPLSPLLLSVKTMCRSYLTGTHSPTTLVAAASLRCEPWRS